MADFVNEDDLKTFEGWLRYQGVDAATTSQDELASWRATFDEARQSAAKAGTVGLMKLRAVAGEHRYAVALAEEGDLWIALWVRRSPKGEFFVLVPRPDRSWNPHTSYHLDGTLHVKSYGDKVLRAVQRQPLTGTFRGVESLGIIAGYAPKSVGAVCDPTAFSGIVKVPPGVLGPRNGSVSVDLMEPREKVPDAPGRIVVQPVFQDVTPWVAITVRSSPD